jgi:hypothetical protein
MERGGRGRRDPSRDAHAPLEILKMKKQVSVAVWAAAAAAIGLAATAHADDTGQQFQSPSTNIECWVRATEAGCDIGDYTYVPPTPFPTQQVPVPCPSDDVIRFHIGPAHPAVGYCHPNAPALTGLHAPGLQTLDYGQTRAVGVMTCDSEPSGVTCTDTSSGHFFRVSRESYQIG